MRHAMPFPDTLHAAFDQWTVGALVTNLLWTRCLGAAAIAAAQQQRLAERLAHARMHSPYYRRAWRDLPTGPLRLADLPVVTKGELMASFDDWSTDRAIAWRDVEPFIAARAHIGERFRGRYLVWTSSGTTGTPGVFLQDAAALAVYDALVSVQVVGGPFGAGDWNAASRNGRAALITADCDHFAGITSWRRQAQRKPWLDMKSFAVTDSLPSIVAGLNAYDPAYVASYPTVLALLAEEQNAGRLHLDLAGLWSGGEALSAAAQTAIEDAFGAPVNNEYGASECLSLGYACRHGALHLNADWVVLEPVDRHYNPTAPGELSHTVLLTNLANAVQPIIRYDLGDRVRMRVGPCPCGNPLPVTRARGACRRHPRADRDRRRHRQAAAARHRDRGRGRRAHLPLPDRAGRRGRIDVAAVAGRPRQKRDRARGVARLSRGAGACQRDGAPVRARAQGNARRQAAARL